jgi:cytochrome c oxidase subunit I+III
MTTVGQGPPRTLDVRQLPSYRYGQGSLMWWGTIGLMLIEGTVFGLGVMVYLYLQGNADAWPLDAAPPDLRWGTTNTAILLLSLWPNQRAKAAAEREDRAKARFWLLVCLVFAAAFLAVRTLEFTTLNVSWTANAYGSVVWLLLGLHTTHLITDTVDTGVLGALLFSKRFENKRFVDVSENALYWYFVVASWLPIYGVIYLAPLL